MIQESIMETLHPLFDYIGGFFWSVTYLLIAYTAFVNKKDYRLSIPITTLIINFSWETASVILSFATDASPSRMNFIRFSWFIFDIFILSALFYKDYDNKKSRLTKSTILWTVITIFFVWLFFTTDKGMLISSFAIDIHMAFMFFYFRKRLDPSLRTHIAATKLIGDICACISYGVFHIAVPIMAFGSFVFNTLYFLYAIKEKQNCPNIDKNFRQNEIICCKQVKKLLFNKKKYNHFNKKYKKKVKHKKTHRKK